VVSAVELKLCLLHFGPASPPKEFPAFSSRLPKNCCLTEKNMNDTCAEFQIFLGAHSQKQVLQNIVLQ